MIMIMMMMRLCTVALVLVVTLDLSSSLLRGYSNTRTWGTGRQGRRLGGRGGRLRTGRQQVRDESEESDHLIIMTSSY